MLSVRAMRLNRYIEQPSGLLESRLCVTRITPRELHITNASLITYMAILSLNGFVKKSQWWPTTSGSINSLIATHYSAPGNFTNWFLAQSVLKSSKNCCSQLRTYLCRIIIFEAFTKKEKRSKKKYLNFINIRVLQNVLLTQQLN